MRVGELEIQAVEDGRFLAQPELEYPAMPAERWDPYRDLLHEGKRVPNQIGGYLISGAGRKVLVDAGFGPADVEGWETGSFLASLEALGTHPDEIDHVIFTHLHFDHVGWASVDGKPTFANAVHHTHQRDWDYFMVGYQPTEEELTFPAEMLPPNKLAPLERFERWDSDGEIIPGFEAVATFGHTPGHSAIRVRSNGESVLLIGDLAHHQAELLEHDWQGVIDVEEEVARESRWRTVNELADSGELFAAAHFGGFEWGRVVRRDGCFAWERYAGSGEANG